MSVNGEHKTVLLAEAVSGLITDFDGLYIDGTFGRGGHTSLILSQLSGLGKLLAIDKDPEACDTARKRFSADERFEITQTSFSSIRQLVEQKNFSGKVSGVLLDLGVSSPQIDDSARGFSFLKDGPLDMRMNPNCGASAADWLSIAEEQEIAKVLKDFGEERYSKRIARAIVSARHVKPITRTVQLANIIKDANPSWEKNKHPATRAFQGIRIFINKELDDLKKALPDILEILAVGGRLVVISFHSLEDRIVKRFIRDQEKGNSVPKGFPIFEKDIIRRMCSITKAVKSTDLEIKNNIRARSAVMRIAQKVI
ncbi:MAG: 16S rRNA (cytosine(1402)-N(4))-methyltransferase [Porticoccus sp.]|jgi:16S rRNA (cytosine1402-N4)-methyltransferase|nr:16S rRNA (cytosine(1402)-N(4))-methyltransferase [Porticoccus sp.]